MSDTNSDNNNNDFDKDAFIASQRAQNNGNLEIAVAVLGREGFELRKERRELREKVERLKEKAAQAPAEDALVLSQDEAAEYSKIKEYLKENELDLEQIKETLAKVPELESENKAIKQKEIFRKVAETGIGTGEKLNSKVLEDQLSTKYPNAEFSFKEEEKDGEKVKVTYIKPNEDSDESRFESFLNENLKDYLPVLKVSPEQTTPPPGNKPSPKPISVVPDEAHAKAKSTQARQVVSGF